MAEWTRTGRYDGAVVTRHAEQFAKYPSLPSRRLGLEFATSQTYDVHLWLEDDAFVFDTTCDTWPAALLNQRAGAFRANSWGYINSAHYLSTPGHDLELLQHVRQPAYWDSSVSMYMERDGVKVLNLHAPRIEPTITRLAYGKVAVLDSTAAARVNSRKPLATLELTRLIERVCPAEVPLLNLDFSEGHHGIG